MGIIWGLILGAISGFVASRLMNEKSGTLKNILLGIGGGFVGGLVFNILGLSANGTIGSLIVSIVGACICIWAGRKLFK
ncbi:MAG: GlsB/YeaQ/YmgE family stress response membrane protein [Butyrivibrio sp.]|nr:GlsB/YeaQ/YmgE family stress response membrane protein [Butyrivibrio sp.]